MKIIFLGTPDFAVPSLDILLQNGYDITAVITSADKYGGRGKKQLIESAVKKYAMSKSLKILQPKNLKNPEFVSELRELKADLQVIVAFRMLPEIVWDMPPLGTINLHASLLPRYRGAAPINWAIIKGETETGLTTFKLKHAIDTGNVLFTNKVAIGPNETAGELHDKMMHVGADLVLRSVRAIENGSAVFLPQEETEVTKAPKIYHETCQIDFHTSTAKVHDFIRGLSPFPCAWTTLNGKQLNIYKSSIAESDQPAHPGAIQKTSGKSLLIGCKNGWIGIDEVQLQGRKRMSVQDFMNGYEVNQEFLDEYD